MTIARVRSTPGGYDDYGDPVASTTASTELVGAFTAPRQAALEPEVTTRGRAGVIVGLTLYAPVGTDLRYTDQVDIDGERWEIEGEVGVWINPLTGWEAGIEAALRRAAG